MQCARCHKPFQPSHSNDSRPPTYDSPVVPDTVLEVRRQIRESLGLSVQEEEVTIPMEAHLCEYPIWAYSKQSTAVTSLHIGYEDGSFVEIDAPKGFPSITSPGYLDVLYVLRSAGALVQFDGNVFAF